MKNKLKKAIFALAVGASFGIAAAPPASYCDNVCNQCKAVGDLDCDQWYAGFCYSAKGITCHPRGAFEP